MSRQVIDTIQKTQCGQVMVGPNQWLIAKKISFDPTHRSEPKETLFSLRDSQLGVTTDLCVYADGRWHPYHPSTQSTFYKLFKMHSRFLLTIVKNTQSESEMPSSWKIQWTCLKRRFTFELLKIKRIMHGK
jgi:hypothetical protein